MLDRSSILTPMNELSTEEQVRVVAALVEGNPLRAVTRMTDIHRTTVMKPTVDLGRACAEYQDKHLRYLTCTKIQCDEIWSFCCAKEKNVPDDKKGQLGYGDIWTWVVIDSDVDYAMLGKMYGAPRGAEAHYSPAECIGCTPLHVSGNPDPAEISTSYVERKNLTMRMKIRRFTRLTNAHPKKLQNHEAAVGLHDMYYNFCRVHQRLRCTPAMEGGVADHVWSIEEIHDLPK